MSSLPERPWTEEEKYTLLTEILKKARVPSSYLVRIIREFDIKPSWADIPFPPGTDPPAPSACLLPLAPWADAARVLILLIVYLDEARRSLNSCQLAFYNMYQHAPLSANPNIGPFPPQPHEPSVPAPIPLDNVMRKRPFPPDKAIRVPRAIQPRPATSTASYSSESGASALLSPSSESITYRGEPARKRGRPSKAESERRKAAAEARGETYPPPRRSSSNKVKGSSTPASPSGIGPLGPPFNPQASSRPSDPLQHDMRYVPLPGRPLALMGPSNEERPRNLPNQEMGPTMRELPRPPEIRQTLPSPQALQLGHRDPLARREPGAPFEPRPPDRTPFMESNRRSLIHPPSRHPDDPPTSAPELPISRPSENRPE
ncbi:hypothetical protein BO70DRAFT_355650 [Aspergillus heteromorphus CBS 117.55]|uniref:Uncharacterized protein n=1 Tax=Aspergillus heteromorphus CBS 117.55 TaxID=1448321 RepID=A0A317V800_9EURO|nr:uncharacterized protein BO70DRAFT_355650 [Aspergillus heteromorphus CBS 117.55]PWY70185.1 hypothetical protein BO70DRAFT_355650 [Aspergillus heteromorphus CBS 117.55]